MANKYKPAEVKGMSVDPYRQGQLAEAYPHLVDIARDGGLTSEYDADVYFRYLAFLFDPASPMVKDFIEIRERKKNARAETGANHKKEHFKTLHLFLSRVIKSLEWRLILAKQFAYDEYEERVYDPIKTDEGIKDADIISAATKKDILLKQMQAIAKELPAMTEAFYGRDKEIVEEAKKMDFSPEGIAKMNL